MKESVLLDVKRAFNFAIYGSNPVAPTSKPLASGGAGQFEARRAGSEGRVVGAFGRAWCRLAPSAGGLIAGRPAAAPDVLVVVPSVPP